LQAEDEEVTSGLALAEKTFGPLLSPVTASEAAWTNYAANRSSTFEKFAVDPHRSFKELGDDAINDYMSKCVSELENEMELPEGTLKKCVVVLNEGCEVEEEVTNPQTAWAFARVYSPSSPAYIDVHFDYANVCGMHEVRWNYALGFKITHKPRPEHANIAALRKEVDNLDRVSASSMHNSKGWRSVCHGFFDNSNGNSGRKWRRIERGAVDLTQNDVLEISKALFGDIEEPAPGASDAEKLEYRRKLVWSVRLLFAAVGIGYQIACTDSEEDKSSDSYGLRSIKWVLETDRSDSWVARGVRKACGFQLSSDADEDAKSHERRREEEEGNYWVDDDDDDDDSAEDSMDDENSDDAYW